VANTGLGHDRDGDSFHDFLDHCWIRHASHATLHPDIGRDALEGHDGRSTSFFGDTGLEKKKTIG
jgi:hypothetical protein